MKPVGNSERSSLKTKKKGNVTINPKKEDLMAEKKLDPVGKADSDIDNDGDVDKSDKYLHMRRKVRSKAIKMREAALDALRAKRVEKPKGQGAVDTAPEMEEETEAPAPKVDDSEAKQKSKNRMKQKMMQMTIDHDRKRQGMN